MELRWHKWISKADNRLSRWIVRCNQAIADLYSSLWVVDRVYTEITGIQHMPLFSVPGPFTMRHGPLPNFKIHLRYYEKIYLWIVAGIKMKKLMIRSIHLQKSASFLKDLSFGLEYTEDMIVQDSPRDGLLLLMFSSYPHSIPYLPISNTFFSNYYDRYLSYPSTCFL